VKYVPPYGVTGNPDASYVNGDPSIGRQGSIPPAAAFENPQREIVNLISDAQQTPSDADLHQQTRAVRDGKLTFCIDSGPLNQIQVQIPGPPLTAYTAGLMINVLVAHTNTGPTRISIGSLNPTAVKRPDGSELSASDLLAGMVATLVCDGTYFQCINIGTGEVGGGAPPSITEVDIPYVHDTGTANHVIGLYSPPLPDIREGRTVEVKLANNVTGPTDFTPNNFPVHNVAHPDGSPIKAGDGVVNQIWLLCFDGVNWQLLGVYWSSIPATPAVPQAGSGKSLQFKYTYMAGATMSFFRRLPSLNGNRQVWTVSFFVKGMVGQLPNNQPVANTQYAFRDWYFGAGDEGRNGDYTAVLFEGGPTGNNFNLWWNSPMAAIASPAVPIGTINRVGLIQDDKWHHLLCTADGANMTVYIDGVASSQGATVGNAAWNATRWQEIGTMGTGYQMAWGNQWAGTHMRICEFYNIDGYVQPWTMFATNLGGVFVPKVYTGPWGINGCYLNWNDSSAATTTTLGKDWSGQGNNWEPFNFDISSIMTDYPGNPTS
jgi:Concanavalin A-like lectin/glucanases superfamily